MSEKDLKYKDLYYVAVKLFLENEGKLFIFKDKWGDWDLPGGRIRKYEFETPIEAVITRKMNEEVGEHVRYELHNPMVTFRHERVEQDTGNDENPTIRIFGIGYQASLLDGEPRLSDHHIEMEWVDIETFKPETYFTGGWLKGVQEYLEIKRK